MISKKMRNEIQTPSPIRAMFEKGAQLKSQFGADKVYDFSLGNPNAPPPAAVNETIIKLIQKNTPGLHGYMPNAGHKHIRERIAVNINQNTAIAKFLPDGIIITSGAAGGLNITLKAILDPGDEVIVIAPYFVEYKAYTENHGGVIRVVNADKDTFLPRPDAIKSALTGNTKAIILNSPNNPTGVIYNENLLTEISDILTEHEQKTGAAIYVISDEPYREIVYDNIKLPQTADIFKNAVICYSFSKSLSLAGERIGYTAVSPGTDDYHNLINALILTNRTLGFVNANALFQEVIGECLDIKINTDAYRKKRDMLYNIITKAGFECNIPGGAFYLFPKSPIESDTDFCDKYLLPQNILAAPGCAFGFPGYFRLAYCVSEECIINSEAAFINAINQLR